nr:transmembrane protein 41B isoform X3 [Oryctolagus cuniculus]
MAKGRVVERSSTEAPHTTPVRDGAARTRGPAASGSGDHLKEKAWAEAGSARMSLLILVSIFLSAAFVMFLVYKNFPQLSEEERMNMKVPRDMDDAKALGKILSKYKDTFYVQVLVAYFATYILYPFPSFVQEKI